MIEGSLEVKLPTIWTDEKQSREEAERRERRRKKSRRERVRRKKMQMREKVGKSRNTVLFQWFVAPDGRKVGSLKRRVRSQLARWEMKKCTPLWREAHFQVKMYKAHHCRTTFGSWDVEKVHAVVARSTFPSQNVQNTPLSDHVWKLRCRKSARRCGAKHISKSKCQSTTCSRHFWRFGCGKSARRCGAKHISKSKCTKHHMFAPLLEVRIRMWKKCTSLWREAHFQVKTHKTTCSRHFWRFRCPFASLHYTTLHYTTLPSTTLHYNYNYNYTTTQLHSTTLHYTPLHSTTLNYTTLHYISLHYTPLHYITLHSTTLHYTRLHYPPLHFTTSVYTTGRLSFSFFRSITTTTTTTAQLHNYTTTLHYTPLHSTTLHYTPLH